MNRKDRKRRDWLGKRIAELATGPRTEEAMAELRGHAAELESMRAVPAPAPELPAPGTFVMQPKPKPAETEADRWAKVMAMRTGTGAAAMIYSPERAR
jgi:hypothetical protein